MVGGITLTASTAASRYDLTAVSPMFAGSAGHCAKSIGTIETAAQPSGRPLPSVMGNLRTQLFGTARRFLGANETQESGMSLFGSIMNKIFHHPAASTATGAEAPVPASSPGAAQPATVPAARPPQSVDVGAVLAAMAQAKGGGGNYQTSIVDLLKLLDLDSSLGARKELGEELGVHAGADGSAEQNMALHKAVVAKLAENGGKVPASMGS